MNKVQSMLVRKLSDKIRGEELAEVANLFGVNVEEDFEPSNGEAKNIYAKLNVIPQGDSIKLKAYFHSDEVNYPKYPYDVKCSKTKKGICFERSINIPYGVLKGVKN